MLAPIVSFWKENIVYLDVKSILYLIIKYARVPWFGSSRIRFMGHGPILEIPPFVKIFT
jgi:hypothetical protein